MYAIKLYFDFIKENIYLFILFILSILLSYPLEAVVLPQIYSRFFTTIKKGADKNRLEITFKGKKYIGL